MTTTTDSIVERLTHLMELNNDAEAGFRKAAENVRNTQIESLFSGYAIQHAAFASQLHLEIERLGGKPAESGTIGGTLQRGWMDVKAGLTGNSASAMLTAVQTAEQSMESHYLDALKVDHHGQIHTLLEKQCRQVKEYLTHINRLVGEMKDGAGFQKNQ
jgi:uncharacterized protein (TIGR02284 family)